MMNTLSTPSTQGRPAKPSAADPALVPPVEVIEDGTGITLRADIPGVPRDKLQLQVDDGALTIEGQVDLPLPEGMAASHAEVELGRWRRVFSLSKELDAAAISAELAQGVLTLRIPKAQHAQPRRIEVKLG